MKRLFLVIEILMLCLAIVLFYIKHFDKRDRPKVHVVQPVIIPF